MNAAQIIYVAWVALIFIGLGQSFALWVLTANMVATLLACLAMDLGYLDRDGATLSMMVIDFAAGAMLLASPGLPRLIAAGYAANLAFYTANIVFGVSADTTFAVVIAIGFLQLAAVSIGQDGGNGVRRDRGPPDVGYSLGLSGRIESMGQADLAQAGDHVSKGRR